MTTEVVKRELPVELSKAEKLKFGDSMADAELAIVALQKEMQPLKAKVKEHAEERKRLAECIDSGTEKRDVNCKWIEDLDHNLKRLVRQDTGDTVEEVSLTAEERQENLDVAQDGDGDSAPAN